MFQIKALHTLLATLTVTSAVHAQTAAPGPGSSGGGNSLAGRIVERHSRPLPHFVGYQLVVAPVLTALDSILPGFGQSLRRRAGRTAFYLVPRVFEEMDRARSGLHFQTDQPAYQEAGEVFISEQGFAELTDDLERGHLLLKELVEAERFGVAPRGQPVSVVEVMRATRFAVRALKTLITPTPIEAVQLRAVLAEYGFGNYSLSHELADAHGRIQELAHQAEAVICHSYPEPTGRRDDFIGAYRTLDLRLQEILAASRAALSSYASFPETNAASWLDTIQGLSYRASVIDSAPGIAWKLMYDIHSYVNVRPRSPDGGDDWSRVPAEAVTRYRTEWIGQNCSRVRVFTRTAGR